MRRRAGSKYELTLDDHGTSYSVTTCRPDGHSQLNRWKLLQLSTGLRFLRFTADTAVASVGLVQI